MKFCLHLYIYIIVDITDPRVNSLIHVCDSGSRMKMGIGEYGTDLDPRKYITLTNLCDKYPGKYLAVYNPTTIHIDSVQPKISVTYPLELWWHSTTKGVDEVKCLNIGDRFNTKLIWLLLPHATYIFGQDIIQLFHNIFLCSIKPSKSAQGNILLDNKKHHSRAIDNGVQVAEYITRVINVSLPCEPIVIHEITSGDKECDGQVCRVVPEKLDRLQQNEWFIDIKY